MKMSKITSCVVMVLVLVKCGEKQQEKNEVIQCAGSVSGPIEIDFETCNRPDEDQCVIHTDDGLRFTHYVQTNDHFEQLLTIHFVHPSIGDHDFWQNAVSLYVYPDGNKCHGVTGIAKIESITPLIIHLNVWTTCDHGQTYQQLIGWYRSNNIDND